MNANKINCIIVDDEVASQKVIEHFISETEVLKLLRTFNKPKDAFKYLQLNTHIDLVFLDINMPEQHGIDFYKSLDPAPAVIFTTAYPQYAVEGFEVNAIDYLLKPFAYERFLKAIKKVIQQFADTGHSRSFLAIKENKTVHRVDVSSILFVEAAGDYVKVVTNNKRILTHSTFTEFLTQLSDPFLRIHKSFCVNTDYITKLSGNQIYINELALPIGQTYKSKVVQTLNL